MTALTLFPARIRWCNPDGTLTPEAVRMLEILVQRVGGTMGDVGDDIFAAAGTGDAGGGPAVDVVAPVAADAGGTGAPEIAAPAAPPGQVALVDLQPASQGPFIEMTFQGGSR